MRENGNVPQSHYQPAINSTMVLARLDGISVGITTNTTIYQAPARTKAAIRWFSFGNRGSGGSARYVSIFVTSSSGISPRIFYKSIDENATEAIVGAGAELVIGPGDTIEALAGAAAVTADIYISGSIEIVPS